MAGFAFTVEALAASPPGISEAPQTSAHKQPPGHAALRKPTFDLPAPSDRRRLHRSLHVAFDVPEEK